ncbi:MAG: hypothetical protein S0880_06365, partial [Actinomycetota bacterium]|nr:hypothetical protein [Actinomycetota bacterium]
MLAAPSADARRRRPSCTNNIVSSTGAISNAARRPTTAFLLCGVHVVAVGSHYLGALEWSFGNQL